MRSFEEVGGRLPRKAHLVLFSFPHYSGLKKPTLAGKQSQGSSWASSSLLLANHSAKVLNSPWVKLDHSISVFFYSLVQDQEYLLSMKLNPALKERKRQKQRDHRDRQTEIYYPDQVTLELQICFPLPCKC